MGLLSFLGALSPAHIQCFTFLTRGKNIGTDLAGNRYFQAAPRKGSKLSRRWVMYKGVPDASAVPPEWHGWLHHQTDVVPSEEGESYRQPWQKPHKANMTGTNQAYFPPGYAGKRARVRGDYEAWVPEAAAVKVKRAPQKKAVGKKAVGKKKQAVKK